MNLALLHPGEMGAAIGSALVDDGKNVYWASKGRSRKTRERASDAGLIDDGDLETLIAGCDLVISVCPPHAALDVARQTAAVANGKRDWIYLDANAVAPVTARKVAQLVEEAGARYVDGGIIGPPPVSVGLARLYLSGHAATEASEALVAERLEICVIDERPYSASAMKLSYSAWTKGSQALLLVARAAAIKMGLDEVLLEDWRASQPGLKERWDRAYKSASEKGWRWSGEMDEIVDMLEEVGLPTGFYSSAAEVFADPSNLL